MSNLALTGDGETDIVATRRFKASPEALYRAPASIRCSRVPAANEP